MRASRLSVALGGLVAAVLLASGASVLADHGGGGSIKGVVVKLSFNVPSTTSGTSTTSGGNSTSASTKQAPAKHRDGGHNVFGGAPVGTLTVLSGSQGQVTITILSTTQFKVTGGSLAQKLAGSLVKVQTVRAAGAVDATQVKVTSGTHAEWYRIKGVVTAVGSGSISIQTNSGTVTGTLDPNVVVTLGDGKAGSLSDVTVNAKIEATWQVVNGQMDVTAIKVRGGGGSASGENSSGGGPGSSGNGTSGTSGSGNGG